MTHTRIIDALTATAVDLDAMTAAWPLRTADLLPYYERVEWVTRVRPSPPAPWTEAMGEAAAGLGWEAIPAAHVAKHGWANPIFLQRHGEWWKALLERFKAQSEAGVRPGS